MKRRRVAVAAAAGILASALMAFPAEAHGHGSHHRQVYTATEDTSCPVCTVEGCTETGRHCHDDHEYCGYDHSSGYCDRSCENMSDQNNYCVRRNGCHH